MKVPEQFLAGYEASAVEPTILEKWEKSGYANPDVCIEQGITSSDAPTFSTIMPPPNANGRLHAGHGLDMTLKDILTRFYRMRGYRALFLPGADHAGFETQMVFEKKLTKEGRSRFGMEDAELYKEILAFTEENKTFMEDDIRRLGTSCDWSRAKFTLDPDVISSVQDTFIKMHEDGLVYRGDRIVNWNPKFGTSLSDIETEFIEQVDTFYYLQYGPFVIGTVRPETKFGDKYVVMHPDDARYADYAHGDTFELEWINGPTTATIIKDEAIDMEFGTGVMTITPWHDVTDFDIAERHNLVKEQIIDWNGKLLPIAGEFAGRKAVEARSDIVESLKEKGLLVKTEENYTHNVRICERTKVAIEPQIKSQWFIKMAPLARKVVEVVEAGKINFLPDHQKKILLHWMNNSIDWNISRQIVWGISIPAWFRDGEIKVSKDQPEGDGWTKDTDTFDTWFSSGQWPLLTLGYPYSEDFNDYFPTNLMECGTDLVFKWIPRMILFSLYLTGEVPFNTVYFHGMVNDKNNQKMSKSKGNVVSPQELSDKFGTDALRMALVVGNTPGGTIALSDEKVKAYKHFGNKLWNITRFVLSNIREDHTHKEIPHIRDEDQKHLDQITNIAREITEDIANYRLHLASEKIYHYIWHTFADVIIESTKPVLESGTKEDRASVEWMLVEILATSLKLLHPFMPFITEEVWSSLPVGDKDLLMVTRWPE